MLLDDVGYVSDCRFCQQSLVCFLVIKNGQRHTPHALAANTPLFAVFDHGAEASTPMRWDHLLLKEDR